MKILCSISGTPWTSNDMLPFKLEMPHPIFNLPFSDLVKALDYVRTEEERVLRKLRDEVAKESQENPFEPSGAESIKDIKQNHASTVLAQLNEHASSLEGYAEEMLSNDALVLLTLEAMKGKEYKHPAFQHFTTKKLVFLAWFKHSGLLSIDPGAYARPRPEVLDAYFWPAIKLFMWASNIQAEYLKERLPLYKISKHNQNLNLGNLGFYLDELDIARRDIGAKFRSKMIEDKLENYEQAIALLVSRRVGEDKDIWQGNNKLVAKWVLMSTNVPKSIAPYWYGLLSIPPEKLRYGGVPILGATKDEPKYTPVRLADVKELRDHLYDNLLEPSNAEGMLLETSSYYFTSAGLAMKLVNRAIDYFESERSQFEMLNESVDAPLVQTNDLALEQFANANGLSTKPLFTAFVTKLDYYIAMAKWRIAMRAAMQAQLEANHLKIPPKPETSFDIGA